jgi:hypothetical protein
MPYTPLCACRVLKLKILVVFVRFEGSLKTLIKREVLMGRIAVPLKLLRKLSRSR